MKTKWVRPRRRDAATAAVASALTLLGSTSGLAAAPNVVQTPPRNDQPTSISGPQRVGGTLTGEPGRWSGTPPITFRYTWIRCNAQLSNCRNVDDDRRYTLRSADRGGRLIFHVRAANRDGVRTAQAATNVIDAGATVPSNTIRPSLSGAPREGQSVSANPGTWSGTQPIAIGYQWQRCDANGGNCADIAGATGRDYTLTAADVGRSVRVVVRVRNVAGSRSLATPPTAVVQPGGPGGQISLPDGKVSIPVESVALPTRLIVEVVVFSPAIVRSRVRPFTMRVRVSDTRGFVVRGALVYARSTPLVTNTPPETATQTDGWATLVFRARAPLPGLVFPLRRGLNVQFYVQARKSGERLLFGVAGTRLVQVPTG
jgi:hypothetical protein